MAASAGSFFFLNAAAAAKFGDYVGAVVFAFKWPFVLNSMSSIDG